MSAFQCTWRCLRPHRLALIRVIAKQFHHRREERVRGPEATEIPATSISNEIGCLLISGNPLKRVCQSFQDAPTSGLPTASQSGDLAFVAPPEWITPPWAINGNSPDPKTNKHRHQRFLSCFFLPFHHFTTTLPRRFSQSYIRSEDAHFTISIILVH